MGTITVRQSTRKESRKADPEAQLRWARRHHAEVGRGVRGSGDAESDAQWERWPSPDIQVEDIPVPDGGFADPDTWEEPEKEEEPDLVDREGLTEALVLSDIASRGRKRTAEEYGVPASWLSRVKSDEDLARMVLEMHGKPWPNAATEAEKGHCDAPLLFPLKSPRAAAASLCLQLATLQSRLLH